MIRHPLRAWREERNMSLRELAASVGVSHVSLWKLEHRDGHQTLRLVAPICAYTGLSADIFLPPTDVAPYA